MRASPRHMPVFYAMLEWSILLPALLFACAFLYIAVSSMTYPFQLEWMEGQSIDVVQRVVSGLPLYTEPSLEYVPLIYPPYYFYVAALVSLVTGVDFFPARLVSFLATLGICAIIYAWLRREDAGWKTALTGACLFLATYRLSGRWFDMSRVDSLFLFLTLAGLYVAVYKRGFAHALCAAALLAAAFFTKQTALMIAAPVFLAVLALDWRHALLTGVLLAAIVALGVGVANVASEGWFGFYLFTVPAGHPMEHSMLWRFWKGDIFGQVGIFFLSGMAAILYLFICRQWRKGLLYLCMAIGFIGASYASRLHSYGYINVLMPMHSFLGLAVGLGLACCNRMRRRYLALPLVGVLVLVELSTFIYSPARQIPGQDRLEAGQRFLEQLALHEGEVFMPEIQFIQTRIGKHSYAFGMAAFDVLRANLGDRKHIKQRLSKELEEAIRSRRFSAIMPGRMIWLPDLSLHYRMDRHIPYPHPYVTGAIGSMPTDLYVRRQGWTDGQH